MPPARKRHLALAALIALLLVVSYPLLRDAWWPRGRPSSGPPAAPVVMPSLSPAASWVRGPAAVPPGTPMALVVFSVTDPRASDLLAEAEAWHDAYAARGVMVVGLHRPEFAFAADTSGLFRALARLGISFPVAHDPGLEVRLPSGRIRAGVLVGEAGGSAFLATNAAERADADRWLRARAEARRYPLPVAGERRASDARRLLRLGAGQVGEGPLAGATPGVPLTFITQTRREEEGRPWVPTPVGRWTPRGEGLEAARPGAANFVAIRYHAARVGVVVSPPAGGTARLWILRDEEWVPEEFRGSDLRADARGATWVDVSEPRLLVAIEKDAGWHVLKISPDATGVVLHALTFDGPPEATGSR